MLYHFTCEIMVKPAVYMQLNCVGVVACDYASRRSRTMDTVKLTVCVCVCVFQL